MVVTLLTLSLCKRRRPTREGRSTMVTFLVFHLSGLCTPCMRFQISLPGMVIDSVPSTAQLLLSSPFLLTYVIHTGPSITTNFTFVNFSPESMNTPIPAIAAAYVTINGKPNPCFFDFHGVFKTGGEVVVGLTADRDSIEPGVHAGQIPDSLSTRRWIKAT